MALRDRFRRYTDGYTLLDVDPLGAARNGELPPRLSLVQVAILWKHPGAMGLIGKEHFRLARTIGYDGSGAGERPTEEERTEKHQLAQTVRALLIATGSGDLKSGHVNSSLVDATTKWVLSPSNGWNCDDPALEMKPPQITTVMAEDFRDFLRSTGDWPLSSDVPLSGWWPDGETAKKPNARKLRKHSKKDNWRDIMEHIYDELTKKRKGTGPTLTQFKVALRRESKIEYVAGNAGETRDGSEIEKPWCYSDAKTALSEKALEKRFYNITKSRGHK